MYQKDLYIMSNNKSESKILKSASEVTSEMVELMN